MYAHRTRLGSVELAFTDDELDLGLVVGDARPDRAGDVLLLMDDFAPGAELCDMVQVHGTRVVEAGGGPRQECDALVTDRPDVVLMVRVADCVPVLLADPTAGVVGAAHAGRRGMADGVVAATLAHMRELGAREVHAWLGPSICGRCYEVPAALQAQVAQVEPASASTTAWGTPALDVAAGVRAQLVRAEVAVSEVSHCTLESPSLHSYRRDGERAGRLAGVIRRWP